MQTHYQISLSLSLNMCIFGLCVYVIITGGAEIISSPQLEMFRCTTTSSRTSRYKKSASIEASSSRFAPAATATTSTTMTSHQLLEQITRSEHAPGIRRAGCPCCDPDGANIYIDKMMRGL